MKKQIFRFFRLMRTSPEINTRLSDENDEVLPKFCFFDRVCYGEDNATTDHSPEGTQYIQKAGEPERPAHTLPTP
jgi:hypothetical protein